MSPHDEPLDSSADDTPATRTLLDGLARDPDGWRRLIRRAESKLRVLLHFRMSPRLREVLDEDDLMQEVWTEAARKLASFEYRGPGSLQRWLAGILANKLRHAHRIAQRIGVPSSRLAPASTALAAGSLEALLASTQSSVSAHARKRELETRVRDVLRRLPEPEREAVLLKVFEGLNGREAAERLGVDESTVSVRFKRALETCAIHLREFAP